MLKKILGRDQILRSQQVEKTIKDIINLARNVDKIANSLQELPQIWKFIESQFKEWQSSYTSGATVSHPGMTREINALLGRLENLQSGLNFYLEHRIHT